LRAELLDGFILRLSSGIVYDKRCSEGVRVAETKRASIVATVAYSTTSVVLEHEDGVVVWVVHSGDGGGVEIPGFALRGDIVGLDVDREARVVEAEVLAWRRFERDAGPLSEIFVGAGLGCGSEGTDVVERRGVLGIDSGYTLLNDVDDNDRLNIC